MKKSFFGKLVISASILLLSTGALAIGGSGDDDPPPPPPPPTGGGACGPAPSESQLLRTGSGGPFSVATKSVSSFSASGFGGGTIHYPTNSNCGRMGGIAVVPGYVSYESSIRWWGPRLASWGFVVITIDTNSIYDQPNSRASQLSAALDHIIRDSTVGGMVDSSRLGAIGWSMGGGGALRLSTQRSAVKAIIPQAPYYSGSYGSSSTPAFIISCENDSVASTRTHADAFYGRQNGPKMQIEINNGSHYCANSGYDDEDILGKAGISWMKRYIDGDTRYNQFLCGNESYSSSDVSMYRHSNCP